MPALPDDAADVRVLLTRLPDWFAAVLQGVRWEPAAENQVSCSVDLPGGVRCERRAPTARAALRDVLLDAVANRFDQPGSCGEESSSGIGLGDRFRAKQRRFTVGVTLPVLLKAAVRARAQQQRTCFAETARRWVTAGLEEFEHRVFAEASAKLLAEWDSAVTPWGAAAAEQVMLRLDPAIAARLRTTAKEYGRSASAFGAMCLARGIVTAP